MNLCHLLTSRGGVRSEFTVYKVREGGYYLVSAGALERHDHDVLRKLLPEDGSVEMYHVTKEWGVLVLAGPRSRELLAKVTGADLSNAAFPWLSGREINIGPASAHALRVNFVGELGWELHHPIEMQNAIFDALMEAGEEFGIKPFGIRAMTSMAIEKSYRLIPRELSIEYTAYESGLDRFVHPNKGDFLGRDALVKAHAEGDKWTYVTMEVARHHRRRSARQRADLERRHAGRPRHVRRLWLARRQVAGAGHGRAAVRRGGHGAGDPDSRRALQGDGRSGEPLRSGERAAEGLTARPSLATRPIRAAAEPVARMRHFW